MNRSLLIPLSLSNFYDKNIIGRQIDEHMTDEGFNNEIGTNKTTGFVFGGNTK